ncbi:four helix bundle protein [Elusimicrobiota bacterium]
MINNKKIKSYEDLEIWQRSMDLVEKIYHFSKSFPKEEVYGLTSQIRRAAISIPSNISEGFARYHNKEYRHFLYIALGSCAELSTQILIAERLRYMNKPDADLIVKEISEISKMTMNLIKKINARD